MIPRKSTSAALIEIVGVKFKFTPEGGVVMVALITKAGYLGMHDRIKHVRVEFGDPDKYLLMKIPPSPLDPVDVEMLRSSDNAPIPGELDMLEIQNRENS